ncbi:MAG TPA: DUF1287 domain-containing protein [Polyangiaceae bacterium]|jgi:hypothetical protein
MRASTAIFALPLLLATKHPATRLSPTPAPTATATATATATPAARVIARAREEVARRVSYDPSYVGLHYPGGDVDASTGVCTDVVIRSYRAAGFDFQKLVHEDVLRAPKAYEPWVKTPDANIDHRRVGPLLVYLRRHARSLPVDAPCARRPGCAGSADDYAAGDIVVISFEACPACNPAHIGVVSDKIGPRGIPLLIHNMGPTPREDDTLDAWTRLGHFRLL